MKASLKVKNFGPIQTVDLDLRNVNIFIGPQASGKSVLAKLYTICKSPLQFFDKTLLENAQNSPDLFTSFKKTLEDYNILAFLSDQTTIEFDSELHYFKFEDGKVFYDGKFRRKIDQLTKLSGPNFEHAKIEITEILSEFWDKLVYFQISVNELFHVKIYHVERFRSYLADHLITPEHLHSFIDKLNSLENELSSNAALYIPAERNFISIIKGASLNLLNNNVPIPKHILSFGAEFEKASYNKKELDLGFLKQGLLYKNENGVDYIYHSKDSAIKLTESASGLQSIVPLLLPILSKRQSSPIGHNSFVIEEPELNLFPRAQYELIKVLEKDRYNPYTEVQDIGTIHNYTTHSPYVLSAFNNILYAGIVKSAIRDKILARQTEPNWSRAVDFAEIEVKKILPSSLEEVNFSAYQVSNGTASSIFDRETGLIKENFIDNSSDEMNDEFDALGELMNKEL